ncbi:MAG: hypothetical protein ACRDPC_16390 [Solirubrobacteraceae bacterium]
MSSPANAKPKGVCPEDAKASGPLGRPSRPTVYVSITFVAFSVTTSTLPEGSSSICAGPTWGALSGRVEPSIGRSCPWRPIRKPLMLPGPPAPPALRTYSRSRCTVTLTGVSPPDGTVSTSRRP